MTFTLADAVMAGTPKALAISKPRSISSSEKWSLKLRLYEFSVKPARAKRSRMDVK